MKPSATNENMFHLQADIDTALYDGRTVEFIFEQDRGLMLLTGRFVVERGPDYEYLDIHYTGRLDPFDPRHSCYIFQLSRAHLESTIRANKPARKVDFLMERPLDGGTFKNLGPGVDIARFM